MNSPIRRSVSSIPDNVAEGSARKHRKEFIQFLHVSLGSAAEPDAHLEIARKLDFINEIQFTELTKSLESISKMIQGLTRYQTSKLNAVQ